MSLFGDRLRSEREARGWTQVDTAKKLNVNNATLGNYEAGRREPGTTRPAPPGREFAYRVR